MVDKYPKVFKGELGTLQGMWANIYVDAQATPKFFKLYSIPYILHERVEKELNWFLNEGIVNPVQFSDWTGRIFPNYS